MNNFGKQRVAQLLAAGLNASHIRIGDSAAAPAPTQTALQGAEVGAGSGSLVASGTHVTFSTAISLNAGEVIAEAGLFDADGNMLDRWVIGPVSTAAAGSLVPQWDLEVL